MYTYLFRSRRQVEDAESAVLNVSMPTVNWNREFGEANISVDLSRTVRNSFDISTGPGGWFTSSVSFVGRFVLFIKGFTLEFRRKCYNGRSEQPLST